MLTAQQKEIASSSADILRQGIRILSIGTEREKAHVRNTFNGILLSQFTGGQPLVLRLR